MNTFPLPQLLRSIGSIGVGSILTWMFPAGAWAASPAFDEAADPTYNDGWDTGDNGGFGFQAWFLTSNGGGTNDAGHFVASSTGNGDGDTTAPPGDIDSLGRAWGMFANSGKLSEAFRFFNGALDVGQSFAIAFDNGFIDGGTVGLALQNSSGDNRLEFLFVGGQGNYTIQLGDQSMDTGVPFTDEGLELIFTLTGANTAALTLIPLGGAPTNFPGLALTGPADSGVEQVRLFNADAGFLASRDAYFNRMRIFHADTVVVNTNDTGIGSLRAAIAAANTNPGPDVIQFAIEPFDGSVKTITPATALPGLTGPVVLDGLSQPGAHANTLPDGNNAALWIELDGSQAGASAHGLRIQATGCLVRGLVINRFTGHGIEVGAAPAVNGGAIHGNFIGTDPSGTNALGNGVNGISFSNGSANFLVGGPHPGARNLIAASGAHGVGIGSGSSNIVVQGNRIGTDVSGTTPLGNVGAGVRVFSDSSANLVGGTAPGAGNRIAFNGNNGVSIDAGIQNAVLANSIVANTNQGIALGLDGIVTPNDPGDADTGANNLQNFPVLTNATVGVVTRIQGFLNSASNTTFRIEFFANQACDNDAANHGEGERFIGFVEVTTDGDGNAGFDATFPPLPAEVITATATDPDGNTSEFSMCRDVIFFPPGDVNGDTRANSSDSLLINQTLVNLRMPNDPIFGRTTFLNGDVNQATGVTGADSLLINQVAVGLRRYVTTKALPGGRNSAMEVPVRIFGVGFPTNETVSVRIGPPVDLDLTDVVVESWEVITALVPPGGGLGTGTVQVIAVTTNGVLSFGQFINE